MQASQNLPLNPVANAAPGSPSPSEQERSISPRKAPVQITLRSPNSHPEFAAELRMNDFYTIDSSFRKLSEALKPAEKGALPFEPAPALVELQSSMQISVREAERYFKLRDYPQCQSHLSAAKTNQVCMLAKIDDTPEENMPVARRTELRKSCVSLGTELTVRMIKAKTKADAVEQESERRRKQDGSDDDNTPPSSPSKTVTAKREQAVSPTRGARKRAQGEAHSPVLAHSPSKRQKPETPPPAPPGSGDITSTPKSTTTSTTTTTTTTPAIAMPSLPQSPPTYRPAPQLFIVHAAPGEPSDGTSAKSNKPVPDLSTTMASPRKVRALSPQAKPRPRSELFAAPPDFTARSPANPENSSSTAPAVTPGNVAAEQNPGTDSPAQTS